MIEKIKEIKHTKNYVLVFNSFGHDIFNIRSTSISEFDTWKELLEEENLIKDLYKEELRNHKIGYFLIDYTKDLVIIRGEGVWIGNSHFNKCSKKEEIWRLKDILFRKPNEIPEGFIWHDGEYDGWLKYRWGDGSNAI